MGDKRIHRVRHIKKGEKKLGTAGIVYALPRTVVTVSTTIQRQIVRQAELAKEGQNEKDPGATTKEIENLAEELDLPLNKTPSKTHFTIKEPPTLRTSAEADSDHVYQIEIDPNDKDNELTAWLSEHGLITAAVAVVQRKRIWPHVLKVVLGVAAAVAGVAGRPSASKGGAGPSAPADTEPPRLRKAKAAHEGILEIRKRRRDLIMGTIPINLDAALKELADAEGRLARLFTGIQQIELWTGEFDFRITTNDLKHDNFRAFKAGLLVLPAENESKLTWVSSSLCNHPPEDWVTSVSDSPAQGNYGNRYRELVIAKDPVDQLSEIVALGVEESSGGNDGRSFAYRIPSVVLAKVTQGKTVVLHQRLLIAQLGHVVTLPRFKIKDEGRYDLEWHESAGALKKLLVSQKSDTEQVVKDLGSGSKDVVEAVVDATNEVTRLENEVKYLELLKRKIEAEKQLDEA